MNPPTTLHTAGEPAWVKEGGRGCGACGRGTREWTRATPLCRPGSAAIIVSDAAGRRGARGGHPYGNTRGSRDSFGGGARVVYLMIPGRRPSPGSLAAGWGEFALYLEMDDGRDRFTVRQVEVYAAGQVLRYDRSHWCDGFGELVKRRFSRKPKWAVAFPGTREIAAAAFEAVWDAANRSAWWADQQTRSRAAELGADPPWLRDPRFA